jgi:hypothetical protein
MRSSRALNPVRRLEGTAMSMSARQLYTNNAENKYPGLLSVTLILFASNFMSQAVLFRFEMSILSTICNSPNSNCRELHKKLLEECFVRLSLPFFAPLTIVCGL